MNSKKNIWQIIIIIICLFFLGISTILFCKTCFKHDDLGQFGDFFGGIVGTFISAITLAYLIITVQQIKKQNELLSDQIEQGQFAALMHNYHEIINDLEVKKEDNNSNLNGREAMEHIFKTESIKNDYLKHIVQTANSIISITIQNSEKENNPQSNNWKDFRKTFIHSLSEIEKEVINTMTDNEKVKEAISNNG